LPRACNAALWQEDGLVPIVEPEVVMNGGHSIETSNSVTEDLCGGVGGAGRQFMSLEA
jgi:fructose-bisphosphate aldolase class I